MFTTGFGFIVDYLAEILRHLRGDDLSHRHQAFFSVGPQISTRDRDAIHKTMSGFMKLLFPAGAETEPEAEELLRLAIESRKRVKDQLKRIDSTYPLVDFHFVSKAGRIVAVTTLEEDEYPQFYYLHAASDPKQRGPAGAGGADAGTEGEESQETSAAFATKSPASHEPREGHLVFAENRKGVSFEDLFGPYIQSATKIVVTDPYIRLFYQVRNMMEFVETVIRLKAPEEQAAIELVTLPDALYPEKQRENLNAIVAACEGTGVTFSWAFDGTGNAHARHIVTDTGWKISLDRGLDIFHQYAMNDAFNLGNRLQKHRAVKQFEVTYLRLALMQNSNVASSQLPGLRELGVEPTPVDAVLDEFGRSWP